MRSFLIIPLFFITFAARAIGLGNWQNQTPGGNVMGDAGSGTVLILAKNNQRINNITRWYFYRNHIVGQTGSDYFIVNETTGKVRRHNNSREWDKAIVQANLSPPIRTRWFTDNWKFWEKMLFAMLFVGMFILIILLLLSVPLLFYLFQQLKRRITRDHKLRIKIPQIGKLHLAAFFGISIIIAVRTLLDIYPQSI
jgi:hypothetical protein